MQKLKTRFTALGMSSSGKTCYILGMYHKMVEGVRGWTITTNNAKADRFVRQLKIIDDNTKGMDRFPSGTDDSVFVNYEFRLYFRNQDVMTFNWVDYSGGILENTSLNHSTYASLEKSIKKSTALYVFIDGELFCGADKKRKTKRVRRECSDYINRYITGFLLEHEDEIPPIVFVVTKSDLCNKQTDIKEITQILKENFSSIFLAPKSLIYIVPVSLGSELTVNEYTGDIEPINMQIPFLIGIFHEFSNRFLHLTEENEDYILQHESIIEDCKSIIKNQEKNINKIEQLIFQLQQELEKRKKEVSVLNLRVDGLRREIDELEADREAAKRSLEIVKKQIKLNSGVVIKIKNIINRKTLKVLHTRESELISRIINAFWDIRKKQDDKKTAEERIVMLKQEIENLNKKIASDNQNINKRNSDITEQKRHIAQIRSDIRKKQENADEYSVMLENIMTELRNLSEEFIFFRSGKETFFGSES